MIVFSLLSRLPFSILYIIAYILYVLAYYIVGYRKKVVYNNLYNSFPAKDKKEIEKIAKQFYKNLAQIAVEVLKAKTMKAEEIKKRVKPINIEAVQQWQAKGTSFIAMVPHLCNWEWIGLACSLYLKEETEVIYQRLAYKNFDEFMYQLRSRFGAVPVEKKMVFRELVKRRSIVKAVGSVSDQTPSKGDNRYWTTFLNQDTVFFHGTEKIAKKLNYAICIIHMKRVKKGYYQMEFLPIGTPPLKEEENHYTQIFANWLEKTIKENPSDWLWSHKRWKIKKNMSKE